VATKKRMPRKRPRQERSHALVEAILDAAGKVFIARGYTAATTNRIAEAAGVSVGSLYQYFPSREAIAIELARRYRSDREAMAVACLAGLKNEPLETVVRALLEAVLRPQRYDPALHRVIIEHVLRTNAGREMLGYEERLEAIVVVALEAANPPLRLPSYEIAAFMLVRFVLSLVHAATADEPAHNTPALVDEATRLVVAYLRA
jgi:AcrR family transcriptional regulator